MDLPWSGSSAVVPVMVNKVPALRVLMYRENSPPGRQSGILLRSLRSSPPRRKKKIPNQERLARFRGSD